MELVRHNTINIESTCEWRKLPNPSLRENPARAWIGLHCRACQSFTGAAVGSPPSQCFKIPGYQRFDIPSKGMASAGLWTALRKIAVNTASSAAGTGAVLGVHSAMTPDSPPPITGGYQPTVIEEKGLVNFEFGGATSLFVISAVALLLGVCFACCCSTRMCSPSFWRKKRSDRRLEK